MLRMTIAVATLATLALTGAAQAQSRDQIRIVGSSTVYPFTTTVAEQFGRQGKFKTPVVESTGTGGGFKLFCGGVGVAHPDASNASRKIKKSEVDQCEAAGVKEIVELQVGYDGLAFAHSKKSPHFNVTREQIFKALAKYVPVGGKFVENPYKTWKDIDPSFPATRIEVLGPPPTSGTRDSFVELVMDHACEKFPEAKAIADAKMRTATCQGIREDGAFIEAGENDNLIVQKLDANPNAFGIFGYSFLDQNMDKIVGSKIDGVEATYENISSGKYPVARPLFIYFKKAHVGVIPGMKEYIEEYTSEKAWGANGYLSAKGLIAMPDAERKDWSAKARGLANLKM